MCGNRKQIERLYQDEYDKLVRCAKRRKSESAEDIVQEAFLKLLKQRQQPDNLLAWLYRVVKNASNDEYQHRKLWRKIDSVLAHQKSESLLDISLLNLDHNDEIQKLCSIVQTLESAEQEIVVARFQEGLTLEQIAQKFGCSESTLRLKVSRILQKLRVK